MTFLDRLNSPKCDFTQNRSGGKIIKFQQSQTLTSHFASFWSIVKRENHVKITKLLLSANEFLNYQIVGNTCEKYT